MLDEIDALAALEQLGTVSEAAVRLRLTQSAVSKRLRSLQDKVGFPLVVPDGRRLRLSPRGVELLTRAKPLVAELRALARPALGPHDASLSVALSDSVAASWGPEVVSRALSKLPGLRLALHAHRSVLVIESVRLGRYQAGLCTVPASEGDLVVFPVVAEPLVLLRSGLSARARNERPIITIEPSAATFREVAPLLAKAHPALWARPRVGVESFGAVAQMVKAGFGDGIVPLGVALEMRLSRRSFRVLAGVSRRLVLVTRKTVGQMEVVRELQSRLSEAATSYLSGASKTASIR